MQNPRYFVFEPFRLDVLDERLWRYEENVRMGRKAFAVLQHLASHPGRLATKDDILSAAWADTAVSDASLATAMREIRRALGDCARVPRFIETVHRRGYRFIAQVAESDGPTVQPGLKSSRIAAEAPSLVTPHGMASSHCFVGRETELTMLNDWYAAAHQGTRRIAFVAGEAGIGKTELVEAFLSQRTVLEGAIVGRGQCIEHYGSGEGYLPILEALGRLGRDTALPIADILRQHAPSWLVHLPSLSPGRQLADSIPVRPEKMLRELADALEILTRERTLILTLEDLQWSDTATLEMLAYVSRRRDPARLLVIVTYRPVEALLQQHPLCKLIAELRTHPQCGELVLDYLSTESLERYLLQQCGPHPRVKEFAEVLRRRTGGLPLFFSAIVDELKRQDCDLARTEPLAFSQIIPTTVRQLIEHRFEQLCDADRAILEAASVNGEVLSVAAVAAATSRPEKTIGARCAAWAREGRFLSGDSISQRHDGRATARYRFRHALVQEVIYERIAPERRAHFHRRIGRHLEDTYRSRASIIAAELAMHFEQGREPRRAVPYLERAARNALQKSAYSEALLHVAHAQQILKAFPSKGRERLRRELELLLLRGHVLRTTNGWAVEGVEHAYARARELAKMMGDVPRLQQALWGLIGMSLVRSDLLNSRSLIEEFFAITKKRPDPVFRVASHMQLGGIAFLCGELSSARTHFHQAALLNDPGRHGSHISAFGADLGLFSQIWETHLTWHEGHPDRARASAETALSLARKLGHPFTQVITLAYATMLHQFLRDVDRLEHLVEETITLSSENGFSYYLAWAEVIHGWTCALKGNREAGVVEMRRAIQTLQETAGVRLPYYRGLLAEVCTWSGLVGEAAQSLDEGFAEIRKSGEHWCEAELYRLRGELLRSRNMNRSAEAERCFQTAIEIARQQKAKAIELRAAVSLGRLWRDQSRRAEAHRLVTAAYRWFTEGFDTTDLREAKSLLHELASHAEIPAPVRRRNRSTGIPAL